MTPETKIELVVGPLEAKEGLNRAIAEKIASKYNIRLDKYDFSRGEEHTPKWKPVFSTKPIDNEEEVEKWAKVLDEARNELYRTFDQLGEMFLSFLEERNKEETNQWI